MSRSSFGTACRLILIVILLSTVGSSCKWLNRSVEEEQASESTIKVYFHLTGQSDNPPVALERQVELTNAGPLNLAEEGVQALLAGPTQEEAKQGYFSSLPSGTTLKGIRFERPFVHLDFSAELEKTGGTARIVALLDQLAYTASSVPGIKGVILEVEGKQVGTSSHPFTGDGFLFRDLHPPVDGEWARALTPADALDLFIVTIPDPDEMWKMMGPQARKIYGSPDRIDLSAFGEGIGSWRDYSVQQEEVTGDTAKVVIAGPQNLEGQDGPDARYEAHMVREDGRWKWELPDLTGSAASE